MRQEDGERNHCQGYTGKSSCTDSLSGFMGNTCSTESFIMGKGNLLIQILFLSCTNPFIVFCLWLNLAVQFNFLPGFMGQPSNTG